MLPKSPTILLRHGVTMSRSSSALLPLSSHSTSLSMFILCLLLAPSLFPPSAFAQGSKRKSEYDPVQEADKDRPDKRAEWNMRGREAPKGESAAALRLRAHQQKMAMRAQREAAARAQHAQAGAPPVAGWVALGPAPLVSDQNFFGMVSGRSTAIAIDPSDATGNTVFAAGAYGGVWKSTNGANAVAANVTWIPVTDQQASLANGAVSVKPDGTVVLVGTGEPNNAIDSYYGVGILRSTNKGATWTLVPSADSGSHPFAGLGVNKFAWVPGSNTVVAATATSAKGFDEGDIGGSTNRGLYLSTDAGQTWAYQAPTDGSSPISVTDVVYNATAGKFFAAVRYHGVYSSTNGTSWTRLTNQPNPTALTLANCPTAAVTSCPMYRGQLSVVPGRNELYFWFTDINDTDGGIWQSTDGGTSWKQINETGITNCGDGFGCGTIQAFYDLEISAVADGTATDIYAGTINLYKCKLASGATTCSTVDANLPNSWLNLTHVYGTCTSKASVHPDEHGMDFIVAGGKDIIYFGNDGGVYRALDGYTGLNIGSCSTAGNNQFDDLNATIGSMTQFVSFSIHPTDQNTVLGGTQDNGSPASSTATTSSLFFTANGGDGGYNAIDATNSLWYTANTDVSIQVCNTPPGCNSNNFNLVVFAGSSAIGGDFGAFYSPYILDPQDPNELLLGTCRVWRGSASGSGFTTLSPNFDTGAATTCNGGEINQVRALAAGGPKDSNGFSNVVYATSDGFGPLAGLGTGGLVAITTNAATTQMSNVTGSINPSNYTASSVVIDNSDATGKTAYVGIMGFHTSHVFKTTNAGGAWADWTGSGGTALPDSPVDSLLVDSLKGQIYAGTDVGIFVSSTSSASWTEVGPAPGSGQAGYLPNVPVSAIQMFNSGGTKKLRVSTYGRGIWEYSLASSSATTTTLTSSPNPAKQGVAVTFTATVTTTGTNPPTGTVTFNDGTTALGTGTLNGSQVATFTTSTLAVGTHSITAVYGGDANNAGSTSAVLTQTITAVTTATTLTSNLNPANAGVAVTFTATVTTTGTHPPTGTVTFNDGTTALGTGTLSTVGGFQVATFTTSTLAVGTHSITAVYGGDANNTGSTSAILSQVIVVPTFTFASTGSSSHTVLSGQTTLNYSFLATPTSGSKFASAVSFSCGFSPTDPTLTTSVCSYSVNGGAPSPTATIPAGSGTSTVTLTVKTAGPNSGTGSPLNHRSDNRLPWLPLTLPLAGVVMVGFARRKMSGVATVAAMCLMLVLAGFLIACGSSSPPVSITSVTGSTSSIYPQNAGWTNSTATFTAVLANDSGNKGVTWAVTTANGGTIVSTDPTHATYTPPTIAAGLPSNVTITATSVADTSKTGTASIALNPTTLPGTYTVTVTASETGATSQTANVTLVVK
jgi:Bacterial Ig-like domain (group 3)